MDEAFERSAVVLDPHPLWLDAVTVVLERLDVNVVCATTSVSEAMDAIERHQPALLVAETEMRDRNGDGLMCVRRACNRVPGLKAIVLSASDQPAHIDEAIDAGAAAYVIKTAHPDDFASAIRQAFAHSVYLAGARPIPVAVAPEPRASAKSANGGLTRRELEILQLVAEGHSNAQLARMLWVTEQTVKFHLSNVYRKLAVANRTEASRWAQKEGLLSSGAGAAAVAR